MPRFADGGGMKDFEVKTMLSEGQYAAMMEVVEAKGMTQAGFVRHLILNEIAASQDYVAQITAITARTKTDRNPAENGAVSGSMRGAE